MGTAGFTLRTFYRPFAASKGKRGRLAAASTQFYTDTPAGQLCHVTMRRADGSRRHFQTELVPNPDVTDTRGARSLTRVSRVGLPRVLDSTFPRAESFCIL